MISHGTQYLKAACFGRYRITSMTRGTFDILSTFSSPYSREATAALKAQFPTQWPTIQDYGFAHPEYIAAINFAAPQDPEIMYSLIPELGKTRWLVGDGNAYINSDLVPYFGLCGEITYQFNAIVEYATPMGLRYPYYIPMRCNSTSLSFRVDFGSNNSISSNSGQLNTTYTMNFTTKDGEQKVTAYGQTITTNTAASSVTYEDPMYMFALHVADHVASRIMNGRISNIRLYDITSEANVCHMIPCKHNGQCGMYDIERMRWFGNANSSGSFTISETPAS